MKQTNPFPGAYLYRRVVQAKIFIEENFHEPIDLDQIADVASFSKYHFIRLFNSVYKKTPHQYLRDVRIENARKLLQHLKPVEEVCFAVGFDSVSSFTTLFKTINGCSPANYRLKQQQRKTDVSLQPLKYIPNCFLQRAIII